MSNENKDEVKNEKNVSGVESDYVSPADSYLFWTANSLPGIPVSVVVSTNH